MAAPSPKGRPDPSLTAPPRPATPRALFAFECSPCWEALEPYVVTCCPICCCALGTGNQYVREVSPEAARGRGVMWGPAPWEPLSPPLSSARYQCGHPWFPVRY